MRQLFALKKRVDDYLKSKAQIQILGRALLHKNNTNSSIASMYIHNNIYKKKQGSYFEKILGSKIARVC